MEVRQGEVYHVKLPRVGEELPKAWGSGPSGPHPVVVIQHDSRILESLNTVVVCVITGNTDLEETGGNVSLAEDEANLRKPSVVNVSQILTLDKGFLGRCIGEVRPSTMFSIMRGVRDLIEGFKMFRD